MVQLSQEVLSETLTRAREIAEQSREPAAPEASYEVYLQAAAEVGVPREAVLQALRERMLIPSQAFAEGELLFAPSADGFWYPARLKRAGDTTALVEFLSGGEHQCAITDLRPLSLIPGRKLQADLKDWGWYKAVVERYDPEAGELHIVHDDWSASKEKVTLAKVRLPREVVHPPTATQQRAAETTRTMLMRFGLVAGGIGTVLGFLLGKLLPFL